LIRAASQKSLPASRQGAGTVARNKCSGRARIFAEAQRATLGRASGAARTSLGMTR